MSKKKKILYVITKSNFGGAQKYVFELASSLPKNEYDVAVALGGTGARGASAGMLAEKLAAAGIRTIFIPSLEREISFFKEFVVLRDLIWVFKTERPDVVHLNSSKVGGTGSLAARIARVKKIIYTAHGWAFFEDKSFLSILFRKFASWLTILFSTDVIVITKRDREAVAHWPGAKNKLHLIYNGIDPNMVFGSGNLVRSAFPAGSFIVGTIGELHPNKGQKYLVEAAAQITDPNIHFAVVGEGEERQNLEAQIATLGLGEKVKLFGFQKATDVLKGFDLFVLPSIKEGLPYVLLEAGAASLTVVTTNVGGTPEIIENEKTGILISPKDPITLAETISKLLLENEKRTSLARALHQKVTETFSFERTLTAIEKLY